MADRTPAPPEIREREDTTPETKQTSETKPVEVAQEACESGDAEPDRTVQSARSPKVGDAARDRTQQSAQKATEPETNRKDSDSTPDEEATASRPASASASAEPAVPARTPSTEIRPVETEAARRRVEREVDQPPAQTLLGLMRFTGIGLPRDLVETAFWSSLTSDRGSKGARVGAELVQPQLNPPEHVTAKLLRSRWGTLISDLSESAAGTTNLYSLNKDLQDTAQNGEIRAVLSLLARGADADSAGEEGRSAVINAAWRGR